MNKWMQATAMVVLTMALTVGQGYAQNIVSKETNLTVEQANKLNELLKKEDYPEFFGELKNVTISLNYYIVFLKQHVDAGHIPIYWLLGDAEGLAGNASEARKWFYVALISTQQDGRICRDRTSRFAAQKLTRIFGRLRDYLVKNPGDEQKATQEAIFYIKSMAKRSHPKWSCQYGTEPVKDGTNPTEPRSQWIEIRENVTDYFIRQMDISN